MIDTVFSFFKAPIHNKVPAGVCSVRSLHAYITGDAHLQKQTAEVRSVAGDRTEYRRRKVALLPYVTPAGVFSYCKESCVLVPSGLFVVDIDHLASSAEAAAWRDRLADDPLLRPDLAFVSPSGTGVKLFLSYRLAPDDVLAEAFGRAMRAAWDYLELTYGLQPDQANKDLCRACLLAHDADARIRQPEGQQG